MTTASTGATMIGNNFNGTIDQFTVSDPNLVGYFRFSEGAGTLTINKFLPGNSGALSTEEIWGAGKR